MLTLPVVKPGRKVWRLSACSVFQGVYGGCGYWCLGVRRGMCDCEVIVAVTDRLRCYRFMGFLEDERRLERIPVKDMGLGQRH